MERDCIGFKSWKQIVPRTEIEVYKAVAREFGIRVRVISSIWMPRVQYVSEDSLGREIVTTVRVPGNSDTVELSGPAQNFANGHSYWDVVAQKLKENDETFIGKVA